MDMDFIRMEKSDRAVVEDIISYLKDKNLDVELTGSEKRIDLEIQYPLKLEDVLKRNEAIFEIYASHLPIESLISSEKVPAFSRYLESYSSDGFSEIEHEFILRRNNLFKDTLEVRLSFRSEEMGIQIKSSPVDLVESAGKDYVKDETTYAQNKSISPTISSPKTIPYVTRKSVDVPISESSTDRIRYFEIESERYKREHDKK